MQEGHLGTWLGGGFALLGLQLSSMILRTFSNLYEPRFLLVQNLIAVPVECFGYFLELNNLSAVG